MEKTTRRNVLKAAAAGSMAAGFGLVMNRAAVGSQEIAGAQDPAEDAHGSHGPHPRPPDGPLSSATVTFGAWPADPTNPLDRYRTISPNFRNVHLLIPHEATIKAGGSVNFVLTGLHQLVIYGDGHEPHMVDANLVIASTEIMDDGNGRIYRGLDPGALTYPALTPPLAPPNIRAVRDRIESVQFPLPGRYLVICGFRPHFLDDMYGYVRVLP